MFPIVFRLKTKNHTVTFKTLVDVTSTFLSNLMFYYSSYFLYSSPTVHLSVFWLLFGFPSWEILCVYTPSILILPDLSSSKKPFEHSRLDKVQNTWYKFSYTFYLLICMIIWLFSLIIFKLEILSQTLYLLFTIASWSSASTVVRKEWYVVFITRSECEYF